MTKTAPQNSPEDIETFTAPEHEWRYPIGPRKIGGNSYDVACEIVRSRYEITFVCPRCQRIFKRESTNRDVSYEGILSDIQGHVMVITYFAHHENNT